MAGAAIATSVLGEETRSAEHSLLGHTLLGLGALAACAGLAFAPAWLEAQGIVDAGSVADRLARVALIAAVLTTEWWLPADAAQRPISPGLAGDVAWYAGLKIFRFALLPFYLAALSFLYHDILQLPVLQWDGVPVVVRAAVALVFSDLVWWFSHWLRHRVPLFWHFHAVHHDQRQMNLYLNHRHHPINELIDNFVTFIPAFALGLDVSQVTLLAVFVVWYPMLYHANVRTNFGLLRYLLVTPQSHRVHHAAAFDGANGNYAAIFSFWDRLFGTHNDWAGDYPLVGLPGAENVNTPRWREIPAALLRSFIEPFQQAARTLR